MCWQCESKPTEWLSWFDSFEPVGWWFGSGAGDGVYEFSLEGERWYTNPEADILWIHERLPGENDPEGYPYFIAGKYAPKEDNWFSEKFPWGHSDT